ncbi:MAG: hypothetical protein WAO98_10805 [Alphaproteobacteria bacterium]
MPRQSNPKNPVSSVYWNDWLNEPTLKDCSLAAVGLWTYCLALAATCTPFGHLSVDGRPLTADDLQRHLPGNRDAKEIAALLDELIRSGAASRNRQGVIFSRRMARDARQKTIAQKNGRKGGNPKLTKSNDYDTRDNLSDNQEDNPNTFSNTNNTPLPPKGGNSRSTRKEVLLSAGGPPWDRRVARFHETRFWLDEWGPTPDAPDCMAPAEIINQFSKGVQQ